MLVSIGASHRDADLTAVEQLSSAPTLEADLAALTAEPDSAAAGVVTVTTCNRVEVYLELNRFHDGVDSVIATIAEASGRAPVDVAALLRVRTGPEATEHLFRVTAGLESMVVGESQISGQIADALIRAQQAGCASSELHLLFQSAAHVAKQVSAETDLHAAGRSVAHAALELAEQRTGDLTQGPILLIGTGAYARVVAASLAARGLSDVCVFSPSGRQRHFATPRGLTPIGDAELPDLIGRCALTITCSGQRPATIDRRLAARVLNTRETPWCIVDLALNHDVPTEVRTLPGVELIDLETVANTTDGAPAEAVTAAEDLVDAAVSEFETRLATRQLNPAITALRTRVTATIEQEIARLLPRIPADAADEVQRSAHRIARTLLHTPSVKAREVARDGDPSDYIRAIHTLFGIDLPREPE